MAFCDCFSKHFWSNSECSSLETAGNIIGAAIYRSQIENELFQFNSQLEQMVKDRTTNLNDEIIKHINTQKLLSDREERYRLIFENANDGIVILIDKKFSLLNPNALEIFGYSEKEMVGREIFLLVSPEYKEILSNIYESRIKNEVGVPNSYDIKIISKDGRKKWIEVKSALIKWNGQKAILSFLTDITTRKFYEQKLRELNTNLEMRIREEVEKLENQQQLLFQKSRLESLGELSSGIAHEINQPLTGITLTLDNLLFHLEKVQDDYLKKKIDLMFSDIRRIQQIIEGVRDFSHESSETTRTKLNINEVVNNAMLFTRRLLENHNINLSINMPDEDLFCEGIPFKLEQVILNLMSNARYAVEEKESLLKNNYKKQITITSYKQNNTIYIEVIDNGIGIPKHNIDNVFVPFFTTKDHNEGTGLGLSISYGIIKNMKGKINVKSIENEYTKMIVMIPEFIESK